MRFPDEPQAALLALIDAEPIARDSGSGAEEWLGRLCRAAVRALPASGVGLSLFASSGARALSVASGRRSELVEELQFTLGEGPCRDAYAARQPVLAADLSLESARWPAYCAAARREGVEAVFAFPLQIGTACLGMLDVYQDHPGVLAPIVITQAVIFAEVAIMTILEDPKHATRGSLFGAADDATNRLEIYQAQGMLTVQLGMGLSEAMARLRAYAFANDRRLGEVAYDIVTRKLSLEKDGQ